MYNAKIENNSLHIKYGVKNFFTFLDSDLYDSIVAYENITTSVGELEFVNSEIRQDGKTLNEIWIYKLGNDYYFYSEWYYGDHDDGGANDGHIVDGCVVFKKAEVATKYTLTNF